MKIIPRVRVGNEMVVANEVRSAERVGYNHLIASKREWNNCFIKNAHKTSRILPDFICKNNRLILSRRVQSPYLESMV